MLSLTCARRKRPFLVRPLENTLIKLLKSLDFYDDLGREKIAIGAAATSQVPALQGSRCLVAQQSVWPITGRKGSSLHALLGRQHVSHAHDERGLFVAAAR